MLLGFSAVINLVAYGMFGAQDTLGAGRLIEREYERGDMAERIVIVSVADLIDEGTFERVRTSLNHLRARPPEAVVLRVESGGGYVGPSDRIYEAVRQFRVDTEIPVVASFGSYAASGGYYVAAGTNWIIAEPTCITGSIGVLSGAFTVERLMDKIGITPEVQHAVNSPNKDVANNMFRAWDERDRQQQQKMLTRMHDRFVDVVYEGRAGHLDDRDAAMALANGSVYTAAEAVANKLIDAEGYLVAAIDKAKQLAGFAAIDRLQVNVVEWRPRFGGLLGTLGASMSPASPLSGSDLRKMLIELQTPRMEYSYR